MNRRQLKRNHHFINHHSSCFQNLHLFLREAAKKVCPKSEGKVEMVKPNQKRRKNLQKLSMDIKLVRL